MALPKMLSPSYLVDKSVTFVLQIVLTVLLRVLCLVKGEDARVNKEVTLEKLNSEKSAKAKVPKKQQKTRDIPKATEEPETVNLVTGTPSELKPEEIVSGTVVPGEIKSQEKEDEHDHNSEIGYPPFEMKTAHGITRESNMISIEFHWKHGGNRAFVTGDFDDWKAQKHEMHLDPKTNDFVAVIEIDRTKQHEFKFVVDGNWQCNWDYPTRDDGHGNVNNIIYPNPVGPEYKEYVITSFNSPMTATAY